VVAIKEKMENVVNQLATYDPATACAQCPSR
jgi:hypothetical protein